MRSYQILFINLILIGFLYFCIGVLIYFSEKSGLIFLSVLTLPLIAGFQNHLQHLQHEGAHYNLFPKHRQANDFLTDLFCTLPFLGLIRHYRHFHFLHHRHLLNPRLDPEIEFYKEQGYEFKPLRGCKKLELFLKDLSGFHFLQFTFSFFAYLIQEGKNNSSLRLQRQEIFRLALVFLIFALFPLKIILLYWFLPQTTFLFLFMKTHGLREHSKRTDSIETCTHNSEPNWLSKFFISPLNSHLHLSHHQRPGIPWFLLK